MQYIVKKASSVFNKTSKIDSCEHALRFLRFFKSKTLITKKKE